MYETEDTEDTEVASICWWKIERRGASLGEVGAWLALAAAFRAVLSWAV